MEESELNTMRGLFHCCVTLLQVEVLGVDDFTQDSAIVTSVQINYSKDELWVLSNTKENISTFVCSCNNAN